MKNVDYEALSHRCAAELKILELSAYIALDDGDAAEHTMLAAKARCYGVGSIELESELVYFTALYDWMRGRYPEAKALVDTLINNETAIPVWLREQVDSYPFSAVYWRARGFEMLSMTAAIEANYGEQASLLLKSFEELDRSGCRDAYIEASMLRNLAFIVRDLQKPELAKFVRSRFDTIEWNAMLATFQFETQHAIGWCSALSGDHLGGLREFRQSAEVAPSVPLRILAILDRSFIASQLNERYFALEQLEHAWQLASSVDWESVVSYERKVLLDLAASIAPYNVERARRMLDRYGSVQAPISRLQLFAKDRRRRGDECMATAAVVRAEGQLDRATMVYKEAFDIWTDVGYAWRAAAAALEIYTLTGDAAYLDVVACEANERPLSWIASRYASVVLDDRKKYVRAS